MINTFWKGAWQSEVILKDDDVRDELFGKAFVLTIKVLSHSDSSGSEFLIFVNRRFQTTYKCPLDLTKTKFIGFSPSLRIAASEKDFD